MDPELATSALLAIFREEIGSEQIQPDDDFYAVGGDSSPPYGWWRGPRRRACRCA